MIIFCALFHNLGLMRVNIIPLFIMSWCFLFFSQNIPINLISKAKIIDTPIVELPVTSEDDFYSNKARIVLSYFGNHIFVHLHSILYIMFYLSSFRWKFKDLKKNKNKQGYRDDAWEIITTWIRKRTIAQHTTLF